MNRDWVQRHRLKFAWALIALLLTFLTLRAGLAQWRELSQWRGLAEQAVSLQGGPGLNLERLRQSAQARQIELAEVDAQGKTWQLRGQVADERVLQGWLQSLRAEGAQLLQWGLEQDGKGLRFNLVMQP
ncbi:MULTISPECIES: type II secretion system protein GspM [Pseudomonas]|uniref:type II secretion system protein GspM n=1 Tax=Pseudomonas TaxID=286 RepID=UPI0003D90BB0|nr:MULTISPECIES: type II secretion system protein GspM [Pseudomonas]AHD13154.1 type II secretion pathway protein XcpZ [Pseudomonas sp. FGI182]MEE1901612.1 type II secretion system protein GspM [Pseudomonas inefficax]MEE1908368.1 type II secretion system protein GspM [Pseudomonas inefficax]MEE1984368.1 type II secretion system protein GspM [Pseudomonas inefficax]